MDASKAPDGTEYVASETTSSMSQTPTGRQRSVWTTRGGAALAGLLAVAVAVPLTIRLNGSTKEEAGPAPQTSTTAPRHLVTSAEAMREAERTGKDVIVSALHSANSTTWAQPDGLLRTRTYSDTIRAKVGGEWKPIDTRLQRAKGGYAPRAVNNPLLFSGGTARTADDSSTRASRSLDRLSLRAIATAADESAWTELVRLVVDGHELVVSWPGPLPEPVVNGPRALYENVRPGIDLVLTARDSGYSHVLVVHTAEAAKDPLLAQLNYRLSSPTLTFGLDSTTRVVSARDMDGEEIATSPTPYLWDSAGAPQMTEGEPTPTPDLTVSDTALALPGLAGPQPGSHDAVLGAALDASNTLGITIRSKILSDPDLVYPLFIDPSFKGHKKSWTLLYEKYPTSSFYNGQNFNDGTNEARVGYEATTGGISRSVFNFDFSSTLHGVTVKSAAFHALQTYSWGCSPYRYDLWLTGAMNSTHTWNNQPAWLSNIGYATNGYGYSATSCPDQWVAINIKSTAQQAATSRLSQITLGLRAPNEGNANYWKKFMANGETSPYIDVVYNRPPNEPTQSAMSTTPGGTCDYSPVFPSIGRSDIMFRAKGSDTDGNLRYVHIKVWPTGDSAHPVNDGSYSPTSDGTASTTVPSSKFVSGKTYSWTAWTIDSEGASSAWGPSGTSAHCQFLVDNIAPNSPTVTSTDYPEAGDDFNIWSKVTLGTPGLFTFSANNNADVVFYEYSFNAPRYDQSIDLRVSPYKPGSDASKSLPPPVAGPNTLYVRARDGAGNVSAPRTYPFFVRPRPGKDKPGDTSGDGSPDLYTIDDQGELKLWAGQAGELDSSLPAAYTTEKGAAQPAPESYWTGALLAHQSDWFPGDGVNDLLARTKGGDGVYRLELYPGDGYGSFDIAKRIEVLLPAGAPSASDLTQIVAIGDATGDGYPDAMATTADGSLWAFTGYTGASFEQATRLISGSWADRDIFIAGDVSGDGILDLVFRNNSAQELRRREGKRNATGTGTDLLSLASAAASATPTDPVYSLSSGWGPANIPLFMGIPDASGDGIPDFWAMYNTGVVRFYRGGRTAHEAAYDSVILAGDGLWTDKAVFG
ncbi:DNRLRE domain-containing protein [Streptomyces sp. NPDC054835]